MLRSPKDICLGDKGERNGGRGEIIVQNKQTSAGAELGCDSARSTGKKEAIGLSETKKVGGEQMTRAVFAREGKARKEPVLVLSLQIEPMCFGSCRKLVLFTNTETEPAYMISLMPPNLGKWARLMIEREGS